MTSDKNFFYKQLTGGIEIEANPEFVSSRDIDGQGKVFIWIYRINITNLGEEAVQLISRYWRIVDEQGIVQEVRGAGVVGKQPIIAPHNSFQYSSAVHLRYSSGIMSGYYNMKAQDGRMFEVAIPSFSLDSDHIKKTVN